MCRFQGQRPDRTDADAAAIACSYHVAIWIIVYERVVYICVCQGHFNMSSQILLQKWIRTTQLIPKICEYV